MFYVAVDIGCIECGDKSAVIGIFTNEEAAEAACDAHGKHYPEVFKVEGIDQINKI